MLKRISCAFLIPISCATAHAQVSAGGPYQLCNGTECIASGATTGGVLMLEPCAANADGTDQAFYLEAREGGTFGVQSAASSGFFDIEGNGTDAGTAVISWPSSTGANQRFAFTSRGAGAYELRPQHTTERCVAAQGDNAVRLAVCNGSATEQAWELVEVAVVVPEHPRDCTENELFVPRFVENTQGGPTGSNVAIMTGGYMMVIFANDSGGPPGIIHLYDVADPRHATLLDRIDDEHTARFREAHSLPIALIGDEQYVAIQTVDGIQFWSLTDPTDVHYVSQIDLPGVSGGDYENVAWQADWQGRYLYVAGANQGLYVIDAADPEHATLLTQVPTGQMGGFRIGPLFARGSYLVVSNMDQNGAISVLDISRPSDPALLGTIDGLPRMYAITATGDRIYGAGRDGDFTIHSFENPTSIEEVKITRIEQDSLYVAAQDHFVFSGRQDNFVKIDVSDEMDPQIVGEGALERDHPDHGQVTPLGNWVYVGNDHGSGSGFFCHALTDDLPLAIDKIFPADGDVQQDPSSAITIVFTDFVDTTTVNPRTVSIRPSGGEPLEGIYTYNFNTLSFTPSAAFAENTTIEIALAADGVKDVSGNPLAAEVIARFSTGDMVVIVEPPPEPEPDAGGGAMTSDAGQAPSGMDGGGGVGVPGMMPSTGGAGASAASGGAGGAAGAASASQAGSGCSCRMVSRSEPSSSALVLACLSVWLLRARMRRRFPRERV